MAPLRHITILAGLAINTSPVPDYMFGNMKLRWSDSPKFLSNSIIENIDYNTGRIAIRKDNPCQQFRSCALSYVFRFNSLQLLMICWASDINDEQLMQNNTILRIQYPYAILSESGKSTLKRCTSETTYHFEKLIDVSWGQPSTLIIRCLDS